MIDRVKQQRMPFVEALEAYKKEKFIPFHTPGHKIGQAAPTCLLEWMKEALSYDLGVMYALDDLHEPEGALLEAQELASELYGADYTWFSINGTTSLIEAMIMGTVAEGEEILIPREAHRSVMSGLLLSGAKPVYMPCQYSERWGVPLGVSVTDFKPLVEAHPKAKAVLFTYPNYYGLTVPLKELIEIAHAHQMVVLIDEAHGAHLPFSSALPTEALQLGADVVAQSTHKLIGSLTQTSMLHMQGSRVSKRRITQAYQMLQSTSPNYIFLASLDMARHQMAMEGESLLSRTVTLAKKLRHELSQIAGISVLEKNENQAMDITKVLIDFKDLDLTGVEAEKELRNRHIEVELVAAHHVLVLITIGDTEESIQALIEAVKQISAARSTHPTPTCSSMDILPTPEVALSPRQAYYRRRENVKMEDAKGRISAETITYYPPGIPILGLGERITEAVIMYMTYKKEQGYIPNGAEDKTLDTLWVVVE